MKGAKAMSYYTTCPKCGASLDPGEKCTCDSNSFIDLLSVLHRNDDKFLNTILTYAVELEKIKERKKIK